MDKGAPFPAPQQLLTTFLDAAPVGCGVFDPNLRCVYVNEVLASYNGLSVAEHQGRTLREVAPNLADDLEPKYRSVLEGGPPLLGQLIFDGTQRDPTTPHYWLVDIQAIYFEQVIVGVGVLVRQLTTYLNAQQEAERTSRDTAAKLRTIVDSSIDAIICTNEDGRIILFNPAAERLLGISASEAIGHSIQPFIPTRFQSGHGAHMRDFVASGEPMLHLHGTGRVLPVRRADGTEFPAEATVSSTVVNGERFLTAVLRNVSERVEKERTLREREAWYRALFDTLPNPVWALNVDGTVREENRAYRTYTGLPSMAESTPTFSFIHPEDRARLLEERARGLASRRAFGFEVRFRRADGAYRWHDIRVVPLEHDGALLGWIGNAMDIEDRVAAASVLQHAAVQLERDVQTRTAELREANAELEAFSYTVSHDLRAPVRHVLSFTSIARRSLETGNDAGVKRALSFIDTAGHRMNTLIDGLLAFAHLARTPIRTRMVDLNIIVEDAWRDVLLDVEAAERRVEWHAEPLPIVMGDEVLLRQVFENLLSNAVKYTGRRDVARIRVEAFAEEGMTVVKVEDNGAGFDPRFQNRLFGVFQRLHREEEFGGIGVGLASVRRIVTRHGGQVWAQGRPGEGASFFVALPALEPSTSFSQTPNETKED